MKITWSFRPWNLTLWNRCNAWLWPLVIGGLALGAEQPPLGASSSEHAGRSGVPVPLVIAPDRGFLGNEEVRDALEALPHGRKGEIVFVTDERTRDTLSRAMERLSKAGAGSLVVLPFFISASDPKWLLAQKLLAEWPTKARQSTGAGSPIPSSVGRLFGQSYFAVEALSDRLRTVQQPATRDLLVVGYGASDAKSRQQMEADWQRLADLAAEGFGFRSVRAVVWSDLSLPQGREQEPEAEQALIEACRAGEHVAVVPFHLGKKLDGMMTFTARLRSKLPRGAQLVDGEVTPHPTVATWMARELNRQAPLRPEEVGVVFLAHGSDYHWNETMREAVAPLADRYKIQFAFCMADPPLVERAVRRLEERGARGVVIVRVFGLAASFKSDVERMIGWDVENALAHRPAGGPAGRSHAHAPGPASLGHGGHHGHVSGPPEPRIRSGALLATLGGLEDHRYFADALLERAKALSKDPERETVILVAHGAGDDANNDHWRRILESLATQMRAGGGAVFRAIQTGTWREDWPEKRAPEVAKIRSMVEDAHRQSGRAIVIPARTSAQGDEREFLRGLTFELGSGFAPHPLFARWVEEEIHKGLALLSSKALISQNTSDQIHSSHAGHNSGPPHAHGARPREHATDKGTNSQHHQP